jgi:3-phenylpropionate/cinnamic acid dioxygenase small subunit
VIETAFFEIVRANAQIADALDRFDLNAWVDAFTDDALYLAQPRENFDRGLPLATIRCEGRGMLMDRIMAIEKTMVFAPRYVRHVLSAPALIDDSTSRTNFFVTQTFHMKPTETLASGVYIDQWARVGDALKLRSRIAVFDSELVPNSLIYPL